MHGGTARRPGCRFASELAVGSWRSVVLLGTSIPSMLSCIDEGSIGSLPRREWDLWSRLAQYDLSRIPSFGDYAIQQRMSRSPWKFAAAVPV